MGRSNLDIQYDKLINRKRHKFYASKQEVADLLNKVKKYKNKVKRLMNDPEFVGDLAIPSTDLGGLWSREEFMEYSEELDRRLKRSFKKERNEMYRSNFYNTLMSNAGTTQKSKEIIDTIFKENTTREIFDFFNRHRTTLLFNPYDSDQYGELDDDWEDNLIDLLRGDDLINFSMEI